MLAALLACLLAPQTPPAPALVRLPPAAVHLDGWLGTRVDVNRTAWLDQVDLKERLLPFEHRPAKQAWAGEHIGKWLQAASVAWAASGDAVLKARLDNAAAALIATQEADGYLGAYLPAQRFQLLPDADWDVWTIKYCLIGLLEYHAQTGDARALTACRRAADLLLATFAPGKRSILSAGTHVGMAATSILGPIARLYAVSKDERYLAFARQLVAAWDEPGGPRIAAALREHGRVARTANGKAYEMLSNLVGLCELHRVTGERALLEPALAAWRDITANELLPTGSMSAHEHFTGGGRLPAAPSANLGETCVTVTWLQLNSHLLELTGVANYGREIERLAYNHLAAAQRPDGAAWCYYTALRGNKPYDTGITCCSSSGPRGMVMLPQRSVLLGSDGALVVNLMDAMHGEAKLGGKLVTFALASGLPRTGAVKLAFGGELPATFAVRLRLSDWAVPAVLRVGGKETRVTAAGWCDVPARAWQAGDVVELALRCELSRLDDAHDAARQALQWGPCVLAEPLGGDAVPVDAGAPAVLQPGPELRVQLGARTVLPFASAGADGSAYRVWLGGARADSVLAASEARSRDGNVPGSVVDGDSDSFVVTFDGKAAAEDWYSIAFAAPTPLRAVTFAHGHCFHDGGWFDASKGKPKVQVRASADAAWQTIGELADYPATTATDSKGLRDAQTFTLSLVQPVTATALRVVGAPACGDNGSQAFSSCAELWARR
jgi:DUF1680 family protein